MLTNLFFVTGTDTDAGKTVVASGLVARLRHEGFDVRAIKPVESGCTVIDGALHPVDAALLANAAGHEIDCPIRYRAPLAPSAAAAIEPERNRVDLAQATEHLRAAATKHEIVVAEGAGGLLVPLSDEVLVADLVRDSGARVLIVGRGGLGTINHTALTIEAANNRNLFVLGFVLSVQDDTPKERVNANAREIQKITGAEFLGVIPFQHSTDPNLVGAKLPRALLAAVRPKLPS